MTIVVAKPKLSHSSINLPSSPVEHPAPLTAEARSTTPGRNLAPSAD
jgi:hypothetical protein